MAEKNGFEEHELALAGIKSQGGIAEQSLKGPAASQVNADAAGGLANASAEFEQVGSQGFDLRRAPGLRQMMSEEVDQVIGGGVQEQAKSIGQEAMAAQAVGAEAVFEFLNTLVQIGFWREFP